MTLTGYCETCFERYETSSAARVGQMMCLSCKLDRLIDAIDRLLAQ